MFRPPRLTMLVNESGSFLSHRLSLAQAARDDGFEVHVVTRLLHDPRRLTRHGFTVHPLDFPRSLHNPLVEWQTVRRLTDIYRRVQPDVIHHFSAKAVLLGSIAAGKTGAPHVVNTFTGLGSAFSGHGLTAWCKRSLASRALRRVLRPAHWRVTFQNPDDMRQLVEAGVVQSHQSELIRGSGVDADVFQPNGQPTGRPRVICASRMIWPKGVGDFVAAARILRKRRVDAECILVGANDPENPACVPESQLRAWHDEGAVAWWGHCSNMAYTLSQSTIVVLPTYYGEGIPKVLLEAAACGKAIVTTQTRGCREIVQHERNGLLVPTHDPASVASAVERLINEPWECRRMGVEGRRIVLRDFTAGQIASQTLGVYQRLLGRPVRRAA